MKEFTTAVTAADAEENEANPTTFLHKSSAAPDGFECVFFEPSEGQFLMMLSMGGRGMKKESIGHFIQLFIELADDETQKYFHDLLMTRNSGFKVKGPGGIFDIWEYLVSEWTGKDSDEPFVSDKPASVTGRSSTAHSRRSTSSRSRSIES
ncbi:tail assembly chaperone [Arthrobacter phage BruhMoment]|nr:tail assembly chaperone [Arthrobacter phage BruhMoment]